MTTIHDIAPTPYAPGNIREIINALPETTLVRLCNSFLNYEVAAGNIKALRYTLEEGFERELIRGAAIVEAMR